LNFSGKELLSDALAEDKPTEGVVVGEDGTCLEELLD
jgi:hypothetical protein